MTADSKEVLANVPASSLGVSVCPDTTGGSGQVNVDFNAIAPLRPAIGHTTTGMTEDHPSFGGPKSAATPPGWKP